MESLSVYRSHSTCGIGEGDRTASVSGEQYLDAEGPLHDPEVLREFLPWMTLDSLGTDHKRLDDELVGWSCFRNRDYILVVRLVSFGTHGSAGRASYFSHGRAWRAEQTNSDFDPGLFLGCTEAFEEPWRDSPEHTSLPVPDLRVVYPSLRNLAKERKEFLVNLVTHAFQSLQAAKTLMMFVPMEEFHDSSSLARLVSLTRALLPMNLRDSMNIRFFAREAVGSYSGKANFLVLPEDVRPWARHYFSDAVVVDCHGGLVVEGDLPNTGQIKVADIQKYAVSALERFIFFPEGLPEFSAKMRGFFEKFALQGDDSPKKVKAVTELSYNLVYIQRKGTPDHAADLFTNFIVENFAEIYPDVDWHGILPHNVLDLFPVSCLVQFLLTAPRQSAHSRIRLREHTESYLRDKYTGEPDKLGDAISKEARKLTKDLLFPVLEEFFNDTKGPLISEEIAVELCDNQLPPIEFNSLHSIILHQLSLNEGLPIGSRLNSMLDDLDDEQFNEKFEGILINFLDKFSTQSSKELSQVFETLDQYSHLENRLPYWCIIKKHGLIPEWIRMFRACLSFSGALEVLSAASIIKYDNIWQALLIGEKYAIIKCLENQEKLTKEYRKKFYTSVSDVICQETGEGSEVERAMSLLVQQGLWPTWWGEAGQQERESPKVRKYALKALAGQFGEIPNLEVWDTIIDSLGPRSITMDEIFVQDHRNTKMHWIKFFEKVQFESLVDLSDSFEVLEWIVEQLNNDDHAFDFDPFKYIRSCERFKHRGNFLFEWLMKGVNILIGKLRKEEELESFYFLYCGARLKSEVEDRLNELVEVYPKTVLKIFNQLQDDKQLRIRPGLIKSYRKYLSEACVQKDEMLKYINEINDQLRLHIYMSLPFQMKFPNLDPRNDEFEDFSERHYFLFHFIESFNRKDPSAPILKKFARDPLIMVGLSVFVLRSLYKKRIAVECLEEMYEFINNIKLNDFFRPAKIDKKRSDIYLGLPFLELLLAFDSFRSLTEIQRSIAKIELSHYRVVDCVKWRKAFDNSLRNRLRAGMRSSPDDYSFIIAPPRLVLS